MSATRVRDARPLPVIMVARTDLAVLGERVEPRRLPAVRSCLLALLEVAGEPGGWSRAQLARRAGVGPALLKECLVTLVETGLVQELEDGSLQLAAPSGQEVLPVVVPEPVPEPVPVLPDERVERARRFVRWHAGRIARQTGAAPSDGPAVLAAAKRILGREPDGERVRAVIEWALSERFFADKVATLGRTDTWWPRLCLAFDAAQGRGEKPGQQPPDWRALSYGSDHIEVVR